MHYFKPPSPCNKDKGLINMAKITEYQTSKGKFYRFRVYAGIDEMTGKKKYIKRAGFKTKAEAKKELHKLEYDLDIGKTQIKATESITYKEAYKLWFEQHSLSVKESTIYNIKNKFKLQILPLIGSYKVDKLTLAICQHAVNKWYQQHETSYKYILAYASTVVDYAKRLGLAYNNPFKDVTRPKVRAKHKPRNYLEPDELKRFLAIAKEKDLMQYTLFRLLAYTGIRRGEILALTWDDVDFKSGTVSISKTMTRGAKSVVILDPKTINSDRVLDLDTETLKVLKRWQIAQASYLLAVGINAYNTERYIFTRSDNKNPLALSVPGYWLRNLLAKDPTLPRITVHGFRHTHATLLLSAGASPKEVQYRLGHAKITTTLDIYVHLTKQDQKETIKKLVRYLG